MSSHLPMPPDPMPLREALRGLRFLLRRGGETLAETITLETLPKPAAAMAGAVLRELGGVARSADQLASGFAKTVLGPPKTPLPTLDALAGDEDGGAQFAAAIYVALGSVLRRLGAPGVFVSEAAARHAWGQGGKPDAATLALDLIEARVVRGATAPEAARVPGSALEAVAVFAVLLWLQSTRSDAEDDEALQAATDLAVALAPDIARAFADGDSPRIASLFARYSAHV